MSFARNPGTPPLRIQTSRPATAPTIQTPVIASPGPVFQKHPTESQTSPPQTKSTHRHFVLPDFVAFRYLEADATTRVVERHAELKGYQCYVVEQWATSRSHPTFTITTYTGDLSHSVTVGVLSVPTDESSWSPRLRVYFKALNQFHAQRSETSLGVLMVTNLAGFPSSLTLISVPSGDLRKHRSEFFVNEDLKRLGCSGRVELNLAPPSGATVAKFQQLYHTSDKNDVYQAVVGLVKLCQLALVLFDKIDIDYADGLLCDVTENAINQWWRDIGSYFYNVEPHDGILGPTTVAGLLGLLMGARNRLHSTNAPIAKDAFDIEATKRGIGVFQKQQRLPRTRRLDRKTLERLHQLTQKHAEHARWGVPKAVKSTVAELSGKGGEMVLEAVGRRDRAGIAEIETCDIERVVQLAFGEKPKWLWYGKPLKKTSDTGIASLTFEDEEEDAARMVNLRENEQDGFAAADRKAAAEDIATPVNNVASVTSLITSADEGVDGDAARPRPLSKRATDSIEPRSGISRLKGAVGLGGSHEQRHRRKTSKDELAPPSPQTPVREGKEQQRRPLLFRAHTSPTRPQSPLSSGTDGRPDTALSSQRDALTRFRFPPSNDGRAGPLFAEGWEDEREGGQPPPQRVNEKNDSGDSGHLRAGLNRDDDMPSDIEAGTGVSVAGSVYNGAELSEVPTADSGNKQDNDRLLRRTVSLDRLPGPRTQSLNDDSYPRHLSFSLAEESILTWEPISDMVGYSTSAIEAEDADEQFANEDFFAQEATTFRHRLDELRNSVVPWTDGQLGTLGSFVERAERYHREFEEMYQPRANSTQALHGSSETVMREQKERFEEARKEIETLVARLDYEIDGLRGRLEDVGAGVQDFRKGVQRVEERVSELEKDLERDRGRGRCVVM